MRTTGIVALLFALLCPRAANAETRPLAARVNPFIGTDGTGHTYPGASVPFGMVQLSPDTRLTGWESCSGYYYKDSHIYGFSHTHLSGTGVPDYCDVLLMPTTGEPRLEPREDGRPGYVSSFSHDTEEAAPGYYAVTLDGPRVRAELTTTARVGMHRYTFAPDAAQSVVLDLAHRDEVIESWLRFEGDREVVGLRRSSGWARDQYVYFAIRFSKPIATRGIAIDDGRPADLRAAEGKTLRAIARFDGGGPLLVKVGISAVDVEGARRNLDAEIPGWDFDAVRAAASASWERELSKIRVEGGTSAQQTIFHTSLYHALLSPNLFQDVDGRYRGRDLKVHEGDGSDNYTVFSLWDTFRALHPLLTITDTARTRDFVRTFLRQYRQGGRLPVWELAGNETDCMIGYHAVPVIADAIVKEIGGFDVELAFEAMKHSAEQDRLGLAAYKTLGFIPAEAEPESVSKTLEYAYDDWCIARVAQKLGREADRERYDRRSQAYRHLFDPSTGFMRARSEGSWFTPFDPAEVNFNYTEANAWQYSFFVPHDVEGLMALHGGRERFAAKLDALFSAESTITGNHQVDVTGLLGQYAHGNEPSHHMAYLYAYAGQPWKTQALVRRLLETMYADGPDGLAGNEDCGQMSAWYILSALGFYPVTPGSGHYVIGAPLFPKATIALENGRTFVITSKGTGPYVQRVTLDGKPYPKAFLEHATIMRGGELHFEMGPEPNRAWGTGPGEAPRSTVVSEPVVPAPYLAEGDVVFRDTTRVRLASAERADAIHFTLDGSEPSAASARFREPIAISESATLRAVALRPGAQPSPVVSVRFHRLPKPWTVTLGGPYLPQYSGGGESALVDGLRGTTNYRLGRWQGFQGRDLEAVVDLGEARPIRRVAVGFLHHPQVWIYAPTSMEVAVSEDGASFHEIGTVASSAPDADVPPSIVELGVGVDASRARFVRVRARQYGPLPAWHPGAGSPSIIFADEIVVE